MINRRKTWTLSLCVDDHLVVSGLLTSCDATTGEQELPYELVGLSSVIFQELLTALDASMFTFLATADVR